MDPQAGALSAIYARRAVRAYEAVQPDEALVRALLDAAVQAPTARHLEPWGFVVVQDKALLKRYSDRAKAMLLDPTLAVGWAPRRPRGTITLPWSPILRSTSSTTPER
jgi:nitroreductase